METPPQTKIWHCRRIFHIVTAKQQAVWSIRELSFFSSRGGGGGVCGRNGMKDSVKFLIPPWKQQKNCCPPSLFVKISCHPPPLKPPSPKVCWVFNDVVPTCKGHCPCQLGVWGCCRVPRAEP